MAVAFDGDLGMRIVLTESPASASAEGANWNKMRVPFEVTGGSCYEGGGTFTKNHANCKLLM
jgi:hypothetical protein